MPRNVPTRVSAQDVAALQSNGAARKPRFVEITRTHAGKERARDLYRAGIGVPGPRYASFADTSDNALTALYERVFYHEVGGVFSAPFIPTRSTVDATLFGFKRRLRYLVDPLTPVALQDYAAMYYRGQRYQRYDAAVKKVMSTGLLRKYSYLSTFLKHEKIAVAQKRAVPRVIQPRGPEYNVCVGRYIRPLEHSLYRDIARLYGRPTVMKGLNASEVGTLLAGIWSEFEDPVAVGLDASRFDQHVNSSLLHWEHDVYEMYYPGDTELRMLLSWQRRNRGFMRVPGCTIRYGVDGGRCSGDMNTACGNCLIMCACIYAYLTSHNLVGRARTRVALLNNGDDCVLVGNRADVLRIMPGIVPFFDTIGLVMKVESPVYVLEQVVFCQTQPVFDGAEWRMVRDPRVCMSKDIHVVDPTAATKHLSTQLYAIGQCGMSLTGGLPLLQEFYAALIRNGRPGKAVDHHFLDSGFYMLSRGMTNAYRPVTDDARVSFCKAFGVLPDLQIALEKEYAACVMPYIPFRHGTPREIPL